MTKCVLWLVLATLCMAFVITIALRNAIAEMDARSLDNAKPAAYFVQVVEPATRVQREREDQLERERREACDLAPYASTRPATVPAEISE